jgi:hypothetical protein
MNKELEDRIRREALNEAREDEELEARIEESLRKWRLATILLGVGLAAGMVAVTPFLAGHPLHSRWDSVGKKILLVTMGLFLAFVYVAGTYLTFWKYLRDMKKIHKKFAPPFSKYRAVSRASRIKVQESIGPKQQSR